jgi:hypothetical protein
MRVKVVAIASIGSDIIVVVVIACRRLCRSCWLSVEQAAHSRSFWGTSLYDECGHVALSLDVDVPARHVRWI